MSVRRGNRPYPSEGGAPSHEAPDYRQPTSSKYADATEGYARQPAYHESPVIPQYDPHLQNAAAWGQLGRNTAEKRSHPSRHSQAGYDRTSQLPVRNPSASKPRAAAASQDLAHHSSYSGRRVVSDPMDKNAPPMRPTVQTANLEQRRGSIPHKSPLQKLETTLGDISKEEKRARVQQAELAAQERTPRSATARTAAAFEAGRQPSTRHRNSRSVSGPETSIPPPPIGQNRDPAQPSARVADFHKEAVSSQPLNQTRSNHARTEPRASATYNPRRSDGRVADDPHAQFPRNVTKSDATAPVSRAVAGASPPQPAAPAYDESPVYEAPPKRTESKRLQKDPPRDRRASRGHEPLPPAASYPPKTERLEQFKDSSPAQNSVYQTPSPHVTQGAHRAPAAYPQSTDQNAKVSSQHGFHLPHVFHRHRDERRYHAAPVISDWKSVGTAALLAEDTDLSAASVDPASKADDRPWWEKSASSQRRSSASSARTPVTPSYDGYYDSRSGQSYFRPALYLKCGPLLRFRGIYRENARSARSSSGRIREVWRGSVMIVTIDSKSQYESAPTLRLFKQPIQLLPPPPAEIDEANRPLPPEYVDPVAGQIKMSRVGKTLFVRPVEDLQEHVDLSRREDDTGLFEEVRSAPAFIDPKTGRPPPTIPDGEKLGKCKEVRGVRLFGERGVTFWKFNLEVELGPEQQRLAYRINRGPAIGFWVPARGENMNLMFHSCNGFSLSVDADAFSGPDPLWRDVLNTHQTRPFHAMLGGGDQIYMDAATKQTKLFKEWTEIKNPHHKHHASFTPEMQEELEVFYLNRYAMWFSQGFFGMANSQIPMVNIWDDHDIMDGFGSYPDSTMECPVFTGVGAVAFKYYMLFQHQTIPEETETEEPSWLLGAHNGPYINQLSRSVFMSMGPTVSFLGLDCRTERQRDEILCEDSWERVFERLEREVVKGQTKHLIVMLGVPIAYPRLNFLENVLTSRAMDPLKMIGRTGVLGGFVNKFDGGVEILDDLDDHWTAKHHKDERNWFVQELQHIAANKSVRITILGGDVHLAAVGQFFSNKKLGIPKDRDHRYMPNVISSAIVNTPPSDMLADVLNKRNKIHHLDEFTDEDMIAMFNADVDGKPRNNKRLLPRRNWCSIREYVPKDTPPSTPSEESNHERPYSRDQGTEESIESRPRRSLSLTRRNFTPGAIARRFSKSKAPPMAYYNKNPGHRRTTSADAILHRPGEEDSGYFPEVPGSAPPGRRSFSTGDRGPDDSTAGGRPNRFVRRPTDLSLKQMKLDKDRAGEIDLSGGLDIRINVENDRGDPAGTTTDYRLIVPALDFTGPVPDLPEPLRKRRGLKGLFGMRSRSPGGSVGGDSASISGSERGDHDRVDINRTGTPLGGWADRPQHAIGRKSLSGRDVDRRDSHTRIVPERPSRNSKDDQLFVPRTRDSYPPPTSASPKPNDFRRSSGPAPRAMEKAPHSIPSRIASDGRPVRQRHRGELYESDPSVESPYENGPRHSSHAMRERDSFAYGRGSKDQYVDPGSPTQRAKGDRRKSSWRFWRVGSSGDR